MSDLADWVLSRLPAQMHSSHTPAAVRNREHSATVPALDHVDAEVLIAFYTLSMILAIVGEWLAMTHEHAPLPLVASASVFIASAHSSSEK